MVSHFARQNADGFLLQALFGIQILTPTILSYSSFSWWMQVCVQRTVCAPVLWVLQHIHYKLSKLASRYFILNWWPRKFIMVFGKKTLIFISTKIYALLPPLKQMVKNQRSVLWNKSVFFKVFFSPVNHGRLFIKVILDILIMKKGQNGYGKQTYCIINCTATLP